MAVSVRSLLVASIAVMAFAAAGASGAFPSMGDIADSFWTYVTLGASAIITEELAPIFGGMAAYEGELRLDRVILSLTVGSWVATTLLYWAGMAKWEWMRRRWPRLRGTGTIALRIVRRNPWRASFLVRFAFGARILLPMACGAARVRLPLYLAASLLGGAAWSIAFVLLGYAAGEAAMRVMGHLGRAGEIIGAIILTAIVLGFVRWQRSRNVRKAKRQRREKRSGTPRSNPAVE